MTSLTARLVPGVAAIPAKQWDACAGIANPFVGHAFLAALEESGSVGGRSGWQPVPIVVEGDDGAPVAIAPAYAKGHSRANMSSTRAGPMHGSARADATTPSSRSQRPSHPCPDRGCCYATKVLRRR